MPIRYSPDRVLQERDCDMTFLLGIAPGRQNRNKVETGVLLVHRPTGLMVVATHRRSQHANRGAAFERMAERLEEMQREVAPRIPTAPSAGSKERRLEAKRRLSAIKRSRSAPTDDERHTRFAIRARTVYNGLTLRAA
jgi:protein subunit release factor A